MRKLSFLFTFIFLLALNGHTQSIESIRYKALDKSGQIISSYNFGEDIDNLLFEVTASGGVTTKYLGCSYMVRGTEYDADATKRFMLWTIVGFNKFTFNLKSDKGNIDSVIFSLWNEKVTPNNYNSKPASSKQAYKDAGVDIAGRFKSIGYFLFDQVDSTGWLDIDGSALFSVDWVKLY